MNPASAGFSYAVLFHPLYDEIEGNIMHRTIISTGAAGHPGSTILRQLIHTDCTIRALLYGSEAAPVQDEHIHYYHGDVSDPASLQTLFADLPAEPVYIIHTAAVISIQKHITDIMYRTNEEGVRNILSLSMSHHITRFIHVSSVHAMPELSMGIMQSEIRTFDPDRVIGGYDFTDVRNVADGCIKAMDSAQRWETYILSGHYMKIYDFLCTAGQNADRKPVPALPKAAAELGLPFVTAYCHLRHIRPLYTGCSLHTISSNAMFSHMKAERELGYHFRDIHESIHDMTAYTMDQMDTVS